MTIPERTCVGCGEKLPATALVRLRLDEAGRVDVREGRGGRGAWVHAAGGCLSRAVKRKSFERSFRKAVVVDETRLRQQLTGNGGRV
ncbi:MAG: YlxR family protein [Anaeromyxobacteraceae bacterium]